MRWGSISQEVTGTEGAARMNAVAPGLREELGALAWARVFACAHMSSSSSGARTAVCSLLVFITTLHRKKPGLLGEKTDSRKTTR